MITQEYLKECVSYDPESGLFYWNERPITHFNCARVHSSFNTKSSGSIVGSKVKVSKKGKTYWSCKINQKLYRLHRLAFLYMTGTIPEEVDHIDGDGTNNKWSNLRSATKSINMRNTKKPVTNSSGFIGVRKQGNRYTARVKVSGKEIHLGSYKTIDEAIKARKEANKKYSFHENHGRES